MNPTQQCAVEIAKAFGMYDPAHHHGRTTQVLTDIETILNEQKVFALDAEKQRLIADIQTGINGIKIPESCEGKMRGEYVKAGARLAVEAVNEVLQKHCRHKFFRDLNQQKNQMVESGSCAICGYKKPC